MTYYRLLRDNKESGPYSAEEMIVKGFKPYDLLWIEGRSAGWRYPSEFEEFKLYAPAIEEQPFDRFYKKVPEQKTKPAATPAEAITEQKNNTAQKNTAAKTAGEYNYNAKALEGKHIHITLPSGNSINLHTLAANAAKEEKIEAKEPARDTMAPVVPITTSTSSDELKNGKTADRKTSIAPVAKNAALATSAAEPLAKPFLVKETAASQPVLQPVQKPIEQPANNPEPSAVYIYKPENTFSLPMLLGAILGVATLVGLGIMIGLTISNKKTDLVKSEQQNVPQKIKTETVTTFVPSGSNASQNGQSVNDKSLLPQNTAQQKTTQKNTVTKNTPATDNKNPGIDKAVVVNTVSEKTETVKTEPQSGVTTKPAIAPVESIEKKLTLAPNDFRKGPFGGISNLKYTLSNGSAVALESVTIEIDYIQANNKIFKTERLSAKDIGAGGQVTIDAPSSNRGVKITGRIVKVMPRENAVAGTAIKP